MLQKSKEFCRGVIIGRWYSRMDMKHGLGKSFIGLVGMARSRHAEVGYEAARLPRQIPIGLAFLLTA